MNLDFASVWEMVADLVPENDALICGENVVSWKDYDLRSSQVASALSSAGLGPNSKHQFNWNFFYVQTCAASIAKI